MLIDSERYLMTAMYSTINMQYCQQNYDLVLILHMYIYIYVSLRDTGHDHKPLLNEKQTYLEGNLWQHT